MLDASGWDGGVRAEDDTRCCRCSGWTFQAGSSGLRDVPERPRGSRLDVKSRLDGSPAAPRF